MDYNEYERKVIEKLEVLSSVLNNNYNFFGNYLIKKYQLEKNYFRVIIFPDPGHVGLSLSINSRSTTDMILRGTGECGASINFKRFMKRVEGCFAHKDLLYVLDKLIIEEL